LWLLTPPAGCIPQPVDGAIAAPADVIEFGGYDTQPGATLRIQSYLAGSWFDVGTATASTLAVPYDGTDLYRWSARLPLPYWTAGTTGRVARFAIKRPDDTNLLTVR